MGKLRLSPGGGGGDLDVITAVAADVVAPKVIVDKDGESVTGTLPIVSTGTYWNRDLGVGLESDNFYSFQPYGKYEAYDSRGSLHRIPIARLQSTIGASAGKILKGQTICGVAGTVDVQSILSFSCAPYSSTQITFTWKNPAKGAFQGVIIVGKIGSYPANRNDGTTWYKGYGNSTSANTNSSATVDGFVPGNTYYFGAFSYAIKNGTEWIHGTSYTGTIWTSKGRVAIINSGNWVVPAGVRSVDVFLVGGGASGNAVKERSNNATGGGGSGYTSTFRGIPVTPGQTIYVEIGGGGGAAPTSASPYINNGGVTRFGSYSVNGSRNFNSSTDGHQEYWANAGSGGSGGRFGFAPDSENLYAQDGANGNGTGRGAGQHSTTREFGESWNTLYAGGGGSSIINSDLPSGAFYGGGQGGGGRGGVYRVSGNINYATGGLDGTGSGGGSMLAYLGSSGDQSSGAGSRGLCVVRYGY